MRLVSMYTLLLVIVIAAFVPQTAPAQTNSPPSKEPGAVGAKESPVEQSEPEEELTEIKLAKPVTYSYVENGNEMQKLDFYRFLSSRPGLRPVLIWFHGGGWVKGSREWIDPIAFEIASVGGYNLISAGYTLADNEDAPWPFIIHDVNAVIRWVKFNAKTLRVNPKKIIVGGESAGAHLAAMAALSTGVSELEGSENQGVSSDVAGVVLFYGPYNMETLTKKKQKMIKNGRCAKPNYSSPVLYLLDCSNPDPSTYNIDGCKEELVEQANPATYLDSSDPPVFMAHGKEDCIVPWAQAKEFADALSEAGVVHEFISAKKGEHRVWTLDVTAEDIVKFLDKNMDE